MWLRNGLVLCRRLWTLFIGSLVFLLFIKFLIGSLRTISYHSFTTRVLSTIMYLTLFCMFIKKQFAHASDSIASCAIILEKKLTVSCIVGYNSESLKNIKVRNREVIRVWKECIIFQQDHQYSLCQF